MARLAFRAPAWVLAGLACGLLAMNAQAGGRDGGSSELGTLTADFALPVSTQVGSGPTSLDTLYFDVTAVGNLVGHLDFSASDVALPARWQFWVAREDQFMTPPDPQGVSFRIQPTHNVNADGKSVDFDIEGALPGRYEIQMDFGAARGSRVDVTGMISMTSAVPEPGTWALMALGLAGVALARRRQRA